MSGKVERIYVADNRRETVTRIETAKLESGKGIVGDRYHSRSVQSRTTGSVPPINNISLIAGEELDAFLGRNDAEIDYGDFRRNIITRGVDLNSLVGKQFSLGTALCVGTELCEPCAFLAATVHRAVLAELLHKAGLRAVIIEDGEVEAGGEIRF
ncbi:MAG: MOSC domain-containing protein [Pseudohongiella sp.]|nr:MOSC domain-containing protein [Pseudohongiella sp.]